MRQSDKFLNSVQEYTSFQKSDLEYEDIYFDDEITRSVLVAFLQRNYMPIQPRHLTEYPELSRVDVEKIESSCETLEKMNLIKETTQGWILNEDNRDCELLQDARVDYVIDT